MPRRRKIGKEDESYEELGFTVNRFADDTSMLGFRYLHSRYKIWFRVLWFFLLCAFIGITVYQVYDRFAYYIRHPLTVSIDRTTAGQLQLPIVLLCNKIQIKSSSVAQIDPALLTALTHLYNEQGEIENDTFVEEFFRTDEQALDAATLSRLAQPSLQDFIVGCSYKGKEECAIEPVATPNGICFAVRPLSDALITRPGPESALHILVDVETHEAVPGFVESPGIRVFLQQETAMPTFNSDGLHLSPGQTITIPVNDIYQLRRDRTQCGETQLQNFMTEKYRQSACYWEKVFEHIHKTCDCEPARSPMTRAFVISHRGDPLVEGQPKTTSGRSQVCNVVKEFTCVRPLLETLNLPEMIVTEQCPNDCEETSYATIMLGSSLNFADISSLLPSNWDEMKEAKTSAFRKASPYIPPHRVSNVRGIQALANELQEFVRNVTRVLRIDAVSHHVPATCTTADDGENVLGDALLRLRNKEKFWRFVAVFVETLLPRDLFVSTIKLLNSRIFRPRKFFMTTDELEAYYAEGDDPPGVILSTAIEEMENVTGMLNVPLRINGLKSMRVGDQEHFIAYLQPRLNATIACVRAIDVDDITDDYGQLHDVWIGACREMFEETFLPILGALTVKDTLADLDIGDPFEVSVNAIAIAVRNSHFGAHPLFLDGMEEFNVDLGEFARTHRDEGTELKSMDELLNIRSVVRRTAVDQVERLANSLHGLVNARREFLKFVNISDVEDEETIDSVATCLDEMRAELRHLRKHSFLRDDWLTRLARMVKVAQALSPGQEYDQVNLLHVKVYYAQLSKETVTQRQTFNLFVLLAEIGGTVGLYLGATVVTVLEVLVFFIERNVRTFANSITTKDSEKGSMSEVEPLRRGSMTSRMDGLHSRRDSLRGGRDSLHGKRDSLRAPSFSYPSRTPSFRRHSPQQVFATDMEKIKAHYGFDDRPLVEASF